MKQRVFNIIILDESGSMYCIEKQAIDGVNETIQTIRAARKKHENQEHYLTLVTFNSDRVKAIYDNVEIEKAEELTGSQYVPACCTPLYDAMGNTLTKQRKSVADNDAVLVTIITDGYENDSHEYNLNAIKSLVDSLKAKGWLFTYIGANQDVVKVAASISITNTLSFTQDVEGTQMMFAHENACRSRFFSHLDDEGVKEAVNGDYFAAE